MFKQNVQRYQLKQVTKKVDIRASAINMVNEFIIAESKYSRSVNSDINKLLSNVQITQDIEE